MKYEVEMTIRELNGEIAEHVQWVGNLPSHQGEIEMVLSSRLSRIPAGELSRVIKVDGFSTGALGKVGSDEIYILVSGKDDVLIKRGDVLAIKNFLTTTMCRERVKCKIIIRLMDARILISVLIVD